MEWAEVEAWLAYAMLGAAVCTFAGLMVLEAPYGRYSKNQGWGPLIPARIAWVVSAFCCVATTRKRLPMCMTTWICCVVPPVRSWSPPT